MPGRLRRAVTLSPYTCVGVGQSLPVAILSAVCAQASAAAAVPLVWMTAPRHAPFLHTLKCRPSVSFVSHLLCSISILNFCFFLSFSL